MNSELSGFPAQVLDCPDPQGCQVARDHLADLAGSGRLRVITFSGQGSWFRVYDASDGYGQPNPGFGDTRFAPFDALESGERVPTLYLAQTLEAALLETALHDISAAQPRVLAERALLGKLHAQVAAPRDLNLLDLRDQELHALGIARESISSSPSEHYRCTRYVARAVHAGTFEVDGRQSRADGIVWHSRQAELTGRGPQEIAVVFADRVPSNRGAWSLAPRRRSSGALLEGTGRLLLDELAQSLDITISTADDLD